MSTALKNSSYAQEKRKQEVFTPQFIVDKILGVWPMITYDPCPARAEDGTVDMKAPVTWAARRLCMDDGLSCPLVDGTFVNSPWDPLKPWIAHCMLYGKAGLEVMQLVPVRPHRYGGLWCEAAASASRVAWLKPFPFHGRKDQCPLPCAMFYWGMRRASFEEAFDPISHAVREF